MKEFAELSRRLTEMDKKLSDYIDLRHETSTNSITNSEDALCEISTDITKRLTDVEDALCDLSKGGIIMGDAMAKIWRNRIESKTQLYSDCPEKYQKQVLVFMREDVVARTLSAQEFKELTGIDY